jgi:hypothetical protein
VNDLHDLARQFGAFARDLEGPGLEAVMTDVGVAAKNDYHDAVARHTGSDRQFSGWPARSRRGRAPGGRITAGFEHTGPGQITLIPRPAAPARVAEDGRKARPGRSTNRGSTRAPRTFTIAARVIERETPQRALAAVYDLALKAIG